MIDPDKYDLKAFAELANQWSQYKLQDASIIAAHEQLKAMLDAVPKVPKFDFSAYVPKSADFLHFRMPKFDIPKFTIPKLDIPELSGWADQFAEAHKALQAISFPEFERIGKSAVFIAPRAQEGIINLALSGWFLDAEMTFPQITELGRALLQGDTDEAEAELVAYFEGRAEGIEAELVRKFPRRAHLIQAAFRAYRQEEYNLAIPAFLTQSDGICNDATSRSPFRARDKKPETAMYVEAIATDTLMAAFLSPLARIIPLNASQKERQGSKALNRHTVLHGESLDYGTKANSLRAVSLLSYVGNFLHDEIDLSRSGRHFTEGDGTLLAGQPMMARRQVCK